MFDERNRRISICLPFSLIFPTSLEGYHAGTLKDGAVNCLNERERNVSIKKITQFELINYFSKYLYHRYDWADSWNYDPKILKAPVTPVDTCAKILSSSQMVKFPIAKKKELSASTDYRACCDLSLLWYPFSQEANLHFVSLVYLWLLSKFL